MINIFFYMVFLENLPLTAACTRLASERGVCIKMANVSMEET